MNIVENFLLDSMAFDGLFPSPVCRELEPKFARVFGESERNNAGVYLFQDTHVLAKAEVKNAVGLGALIEGEDYSRESVVLVKNPNMSNYVEGILAFGVRNGIYLEQNSGIVFAGKVVEDKFTIIRPVIAKYQERFQLELEKAVHGIEIDLYVSSRNR